MSKKTHTEIEEVTVEVDEFGLPAKPTKQAARMDQLRVLVIGHPGIGKTTLLTAGPDCILLACEEGHKFIEGYKIIIDSWEDSEEDTDEDGNLHLSFMEAIKRLTKTKRFRFIVVDTLDALVNMCKDHYLKKYRSEHVSDLGDYGRGYDLAQNTPIRRIMGAMLKTGRGVGYITHQKITTNTFESKGKKASVQTKKECSLPSGIVSIVYPQVDAIFHMEFGGTQEGNSWRDRIIRTEGSETLLAKNRGGKFPRAFIVPNEPKEAWEQLDGFLSNPANILLAEQEYHELYGGFDDLENVTEEDVDPNPEVAD